MWVGGGGSWYNRHADFGSNDQIPALVQLLSATFPRATLHFSCSNVIQLYTINRFNLSNKIFPVSCDTVFQLNKIQESLYRIVRIGPKNSATKYKFHYVLLRLCLIQT